MRNLISGLMGIVAFGLIVIFIVYLLVTKKKQEYFTIKSCKTRLILTSIISVSWIIRAITSYAEVFNCIGAIICGIVWISLTMDYKEELTRFRKTKMKIEREELINYFKGDVPIIDAEYKEIE